ncbi:hypothetical protein [Brevibacillus laterosporus]|uniref:hypothetical protein n=1 Tax=Brevibacillus laterosporus TaxID=1465 RepID=UPI000839D514|nr:hypothetical protein [Brevibacillus laterosporus]
MKKRLSNWKRHLMVQFIQVNIPQLERHKYVTYQKNFYNNEAKDSLKYVLIELDKDGKVKGKVAKRKGSNSPNDSLFEYYKSKYKGSIKENDWEQLGTGEFIGKKVNKVQLKIYTGFCLYAGERAGEKVIAYLDPETELPVKEEIYAENANEPMIVRIFMFDTISDTNSSVFEEYGGVPLVDVTKK